MVQKVPPHDIEAEKSLLGGLLISKDAIIRVADILKPEHFYEPKHQIIYGAILALFLDGTPVDLVTVVTHLKKRKQLSKAGGRKYISKLVESVPTTAHVDEYAKLVKESAIRRYLIDAGGLITEIAFKENKDIVDILTEAQRHLFDISVQGVSKNFVHVRDILEEVYDATSKNTEKSKGIESGLKELDNILGGFQPSDLVILAARPSVGKTSLALDFTRHASLDLGKKVAFFSLEMSRQQLVTRLLAMISGVNLWGIRTGSLNDDEYARIANAFGQLSEADLWIDDQPGLSILELRTRARKLYLEHKIDMVVVDYLQLIKGTRQDSRVQEVSEISQELKNMARELEVPVIALSQLSRRVEERQDRVPQLSDLRDSGSIEQDADVVMFIHRPDMYNPDHPEKGTAQIIVAKHRNGPTGVAKVAFVKELTSFRNLAKDLEQDIDADLQDDVDDVEEV